MHFHLWKRREFITLLGGAAAAWPLAAWGQPKRPLIAVLVVSAASSVSPRINGFRQALQELGYVEGRELDIAPRYGDGLQARLPALAEELVKLRPSVFVTGSVPATVAAKGASATVPIVCVSLIDPVSLGLAASEARPGGQVTGMLATIDGLPGKQLALVREAMPGAARIGTLINPGNPAHPILRDDAEAAAAKLGLTLVPGQVREPNDLDGAFHLLARERVDMVLSFSDPMFGREAQRIAVLAAVARLPTMHMFREYVEAGGLMSYGVSLGGNWRRAAFYVDKILKGTKAGDIPVELPTKFELVINLKTAKALGLDVPPTLLARADEVIE